MFNVDFVGTIGKVTFKNDKVMKFKLNGIDKNSKKYVTICCFDTTKFEALEKAEGMKVRIVGNMWESNYKDKNGNWINTYTVYLDKISRVE